MTVPETISFVFAAATLPVALLFIWRYSRDLWWRTPFGWSVMLIAVAVVLYSLSSILFRLFGPEYFGRPLLLPLSAAATFVAMLLRTLVLWQVQKYDRRAPL